MKNNTMTIGQLLEIIHPSTMMWIETQNETHVFHGEAEDVLPHQKLYQIKRIYPQYVRAVYSNCIVVQINRQEV